MREAKAVIYIAKIFEREWQFPANQNMTLLQAAHDAGINFPSSCRNGTCRTCLCRLHRGHVEYRIDWPGVSTEEKQDGYILPCIAYPTTDLLIDAPLAIQCAADRR